MTTRALVLGTRGSALALRQARYIQERLERVGFTVELEKISTTGDRNLDLPLSKIGDKALFTKEIDLALLDGRIQIAVHSLKDLPTRLPEGVRLAAVTDREDPRDAFVAHRRVSGPLADLPSGAVLATSSLRRSAQLKAWRRDLHVVSVRGNVDTRLEKLDADDWHGLILAYAGLRRLGLEGRVREIIDTNVMLPAVGQGALGIVCATADEHVYAILHDVFHHAATGFGTAAERSMLRALEGGCSVPVGALGHVVNDQMTLTGAVVSLDGSRCCRAEVSGPTEAAERLGLELAELLLSQGADAILKEIRALEE